MKNRFTKILLAIAIAFAFTAPAFAQNDPHDHDNDHRDDRHDARPAPAAHNAPAAPAPHPQPVAHDAPHPTAQRDVHRDDRRDNHPAPVIVHETTVVRQPVIQQTRTVYAHEGYGDNGYHRTHDFYRWNHPQVIVEQQPVYVAPAPVVIYDQSQPYVQVRCSNGSAITGTVIGGIAGGLIGNQFGHRGGPTIGGALIGALIGNQIGQANESCAAQALEYARPDTQVVWQNNGAQYVVEPQAAYQQNGQYCREYQTRVEIGGQTQEGYGTACRQPDGSWQEQN